jgi:PII-like signaling protein
VNEDCLKLTTYFGERDRASGGFLADAFTDIYARHELQTSLVMRGVEGFGVRQHLRTDRLLTLSEDLPLVSVAGTPGRASRVRWRT